MRPETKFVHRMATLFGDPTTNDMVAFAAEYENALRGNSDAVLQRAGDIIARDRIIRAWPTVGECLIAVKAAKNSPTGGLPFIADFDRWWLDRINGIKKATTEAQMETHLQMIEPYAAAKLILSSRMPEAMAAAEARRREWRVEQSADIAKRRTGEAA